MVLPVESLEGKTIVVTGANRGIGLATVRELARRKAKVAAGVRQPGKMPAVKGEVAVFAYDSEDLGSARAFIEAVMTHFGRIDGLINNAAILLDKNTALLDLKEETLRHVIDINLIGPFRLCQIVLPHMIKQGYGRVVNISSGLGAIIDMGNDYPSYRLTKLALNGMTRILATDLAAYPDIKINSLCPGWVRTDMGGANASRAPEEAAKEIADLVAIGKRGPSGGFFRYGKPAAW